LHGAGESLEQQKSISPTPREGNQLFVNIWQEIGEHPAIASDAKLMHGRLGIFVILVGLSYFTNGVVSTAQSDYR
jgi:hypothetical protein